MIANETFTRADDFGADIQAIDAQHKTFVALTAQLHRAIVEHRGTACTAEVIDSVCEYTRNHFPLEERLMNVSHYPEYETHRQQHRAMIEEVYALRHRFYDQGQPIAFELLHLLKRWQAQHVEESDQHFGAHFIRALRHRDAARATPARKGWWSR